MKTSTILWIVGGGVAAYIAWQWYQNQQAAATSPALPAPSTDTSSSSSTSTDSTQSDPGYSQSPTEPAYPGAPMQGPGYPGGNVMFMPPMMPAMPYFGQPGHPLAFGAWFSQLPPARRAALARLPQAQKLAQYHAYALAWNRTHQAA